MAILFGRTQLAVQTPFEPNRNPQWNGTATPTGITSTEVQSAIEEVKTILQGFSRFVLANLHNSTYTNGGFLGLSELHSSTPYVLPKNCEIGEMSFSNQNTGCFFHLEFYKNGTAIGNLIYTWTLTNAQFGTVTGLALAFNAGDKLYIKYVKDSGNTPSDSGLFMYLSNT